MVPAAAASEEAPRAAFAVPSRSGSSSLLPRRLPTGLRAALAACFGGALAVIGEIAGIVAGTAATMAVLPAATPRLHGLLPVVGEIAGIASATGTGGSLGLGFRMFGHLLLLRVSAATHARGAYAAGACGNGHPYKSVEKPPVPRLASRFVEPWNHQQMCWLFAASAERPGREGQKSRSA